MLLIGLHIAFASIAHAQAKARLAQGKGVRVVVDRDKGLPVEPYSGKQRMGFDGGKIGGIEFKFKLELSWLTFGLSSIRHSCNSYAPSQVSQKALKLSCLKKLNLARKVSWNCHKIAQPATRCRQHSDGRAARGVSGRRRWRRWFALRRGLRWRCLLLGRRRGRRWRVLDRLDGPRHELGRSVGEGLVQRSGRRSSVGASRRRCGVERLRRDDLAAWSEDLRLEFELAMRLGAGDEREAPDVEHKLVGRLRSIARPAHGARIAGILEALDELLLEQDRNVVAPPRIRNVGALQHRRQGAP